MRALKWTAIIVGGLVVILVVAGSLWWRTNGKAFMDAARTEGAAGESLGLTVTAQQCLDESVRRLEADSSVAVTTAMKHSFFLQGCIRKARELPALCARDTTSSVLARTKWAAEACRLYGAKSPFCPNLIQTVGMACDSARTTGTRS